MGALRVTSPADDFPLCTGFFQVMFSLTAGNVGQAFEIRTTNDTYGEVLVAQPLDRELLDHYTLRVSRALPCSPALWA